ncbi:hypothetical protein EIN_430490 [Entamoeba invadens IP1]|uniref:Nucleosome assembly protein n=1 Tax=Entamoeba invadens IP1 TaxID=370355 RepID=A0A0A1UFG3_ENTIV|nr:hypothetical protein EIN_430490 [Entamoeba invadens IP1]ELP95243.1 hypothetical protein EIN_430490 [Entamoeba invadens IP1]|eukprot:XP_004262014.1 hypothetical protein EIN_430490 [Entamoeba invadens IP1]
MAEVNKNEELLKKVNSKFVEHESTLKMKQISLEIEYEKMLRLLYHRRQDIITGKVTPFLEESELHETKKEEPKTQILVQEKDTKVDVTNNEEVAQQTDAPHATEPLSVEKCGVPFFWVRLLYKLGLFMSYTPSDDDYIAFSYLTNIQTTTHQPMFDTSTFLIQMGKTVTFTFDDNPYFTNKTLSVTLKWKENESGDEPINFGKLRPVGKVHWKINLVKIKKSSFFNIFEKSQIQPEDFSNVLGLFRLIDLKAIDYFFTTA